jgi:hypothetical protein
MENGNTFFIHFPLPAAIKKVKASFPPKKFIVSYWVIQKNLLSLIG